MDSNIKSNNPFLSGGEKHNQFWSFLGLITVATLAPTNMAPVGRELEDQFPLSIDPLSGGMLVEGIHDASEGRDS